MNKKTKRKLKRELKDIVRLMSVSLMTITLFLFIVMVLFGTYSKFSIDETITEIYYDELAKEFSKDSIALNLANLCNIGNDDFKKIKCVHSYYLYFFDYRKYADGNENTPSEFVENGGDCSDFSLAICSTLKNMNISCRVITELYEDGGGHSWSRIFVDGEKCRIDQEFTDCYS